MDDIERERREKREKSYRDLVAAIPDAEVLDGVALAGTIDVIEATEDVDGIPATIDAYSSEIVLLPEAFKLNDNDVENEDD